MQTALDFRAAALSQGCSFTAQISAHLREGSADFTLSCTCAPDGTTTLEVKAPVAISGIHATVKPGGTEASFDDVALDFGLLSDAQVPPMALPQLLFTCWTQGYLQEAGQDGEKHSAVYTIDYGGGELKLEQWFSRDAIPLSGDFWFDIENIASVEISDFSLGTLSQAVS